MKKSTVLFTISLLLFLLALFLAFQYTRGGEQTGYTGAYGAPLATKSQSAPAERT